MSAKSASSSVSSSAKADDPVIGELDERRRSGPDRPDTGYWMPAFAGMTAVAGTTS
jgi:hypothetical protein